MVLLRGSRKPPVNVHSQPAPARTTPDATPSTTRRRPAPAPGTVVCLNEHAPQAALRGRVGTVADVVGWWRWRMVVVELYAEEPVLCRPRELDLATDLTWEGA